MKQHPLDKQEEKILKDFEQKKFVRIRNTKVEKKRYQTYANAALSKTKNINIRMSEKDLFYLKSRAAVKGIPYQTLIASVLHQYSSGIIREYER